MAKDIFGREIDDTRGRVSSEEATRLSTARAERIRQAGLPSTETPTPAPEETTDANQQVLDLLNKVRTSGFISPMDKASQADELARDRELRRKQADLNFGKLDREARETGKKQISTLEGGFGQSSGFNISSAEMAFINQTKERIDDRIQEIEKDKANFIATGDFEAEKAAKEELRKLKEFNANILFKQIDAALQFGSAKRSEASDARAAIAQEFDIVTQLPEGETIEIGGITFTGIGQLEDAELNTKTIQATDDQGNVTILTVNTDTGEVISEAVAEGAGKSKSAPISLILNSQQAGQLSDAATRLDASTGADGFVNTQIYQEERQKIATSPGGDVNSFDETFKNRLNPNDPGARRFLTKSEVDLAQPSGFSSEQKETLRGFGISDELINNAEVAGIPFEELL